MIGREHGLSLAKQAKALGIRSSGQLDVLISALKSKGLLRRLAEPNLIASSLIGPYGHILQEPSTAASVAGETVVIK